MKKSEFRKRLADTVPAIPEAFEQSMQTTLDQFTVQETQGAHTVKRQTTAGFRRKILVFALAAVLLLAVSALAASLLGMNVFEGTIGDSPDNAESIIRYDLVKVSYAECDIEIRQAAYDGMTLFVVYSIRERDATESLGTWNEAQGAYFVMDESFPAMRRDGIGYWYDGLWIDGDYVSMPHMSSQITYGSETPGELLFYYMYRLDQEDMFLDGEAVEIALAIGERPPVEDRVYDAQTGGLRLPVAGLITFTLDCSVRKGITMEHPRIRKVLYGFTAEAETVTYSPIQLYITLSLHPDPDAKETFIVEHADSVMDSDGNLIWPYSEKGMFEAWTYGGLRLVDGDGNLVYDSYGQGMMYGMHAISSTEAWFTFPYLEEYPDEMYLAPMRDGAVDMAQAVRVK